MKYYMTAKNNSSIGRWEECKSKTLKKAKAECTRKFGKGYTSDVLCVAVKDSNYPKRTVAIKKNSYKGKWMTV